MVSEIFQKAGITEGDDGKSDDSAEEDTVVSSSLSGQFFARISCHEKKKEFWPCERWELANISNHLQHLQRSIFN